MKKTLLLAGIASMFAFNANAVDFLPYVGADYNYSIVEHDDSMNTLVSGHANSVSVVLGTKINTYAGIEAFYQLSKKEHKADNRNQIQAHGADLVGYLPFGCYGEVELVGTAGLGLYDSKYNKDSDRGWGYRLGAGVQYNMTENWSVRAMYRHVWVDKNVLDNLDEFSLGIRYHF